MSFSIPYRDSPHEPYWGSANSHSNFCEEDYIITPYIGEFINTLTNLIYVYYAYKGILANSSRKDRFLRNLPYLGIAGVGIGSAIFHASLKYWTQWCDDLSMLLAVATVLHRITTFNATLSTTVIHGLILSTLLGAFSFWHCYTDELHMHSLVFAILIIIVGTRTRSLIHARISDAKIRKQVTKLATVGAVVFVSGFGIWNIDNVFCADLHAAKRYVGMPWSFMLELHGWWHIFTGVGAYIFIALVEYLTGDDAGVELGKGFAWPVGWVIGVAGVDKEKVGNGHANGNVNRKATMGVEGKKSL